ncbi:MAG TPA: adenylate/guanylate cyclase domain-containing protein [Blastocatellia bacterium]|nr:adenylate/guanylate cyclase domain-containing protein [Blastocatellia bacterium]
MSNRPPDDNSFPRPGSRADLERLLTEIIDHPELRAEITETIEKTFAQDGAVLILDMSGFCRTTQIYGIVSFLLMIHRMQLICRPCIEHNGGAIVKADADNLFCLFDTVRDAVRAAREIIDRLDTANRVLPAEQHLYAAIGIGYGRILNIAGQDMFGDEVNLASKLGEDIADMGEILLTSAARAELGEADTPIPERTVSVSGISLTYYCVVGEVG